MLQSARYVIKEGKVIGLDIINYCTFCYKKAHLIVKGSKKIKAVERFLWDSTMLTQELPFEASEREFIRSGVCPICSKNMGCTVSKNIRICKKERSIA